MSVDAVIFDFGGVVIQWDIWALYKTGFQSRADFEVFLRESRLHECIQRSDSGETFEQLWEEMKTYAPQWVEHARWLSTRFMETLIGLEDETVRVLMELKALKVPVFGLTNWSAETFPMTWQKYPVFSEFEDILVSGVEKLVKPDREIFELALKRWNLNPERTLFIDDRMENIVGAQQVLLQTVHFQNGAQLRRELVRYFPQLNEALCAL